MDKIPEIMNCYLQTRMCHQEPLDALVEKLFEEANESDDG